MARFIELPLELLPIIFGFVPKPQHIFTLCLVNKPFNIFATPALYRRIFIFAWYKEAKTKVVLLFRTLSSCPHLAFQVEKLEIRDFPKALSANSNSELQQRCVQGVRNCVNLRSCTWTRDGSLHSTVLESLHSCSQLRELEINGNDSVYDPNLLIQFSHLTKISLIMPSSRVLAILPTWISITGGTLRSLAIICKASTHVTDELLAHLAPNLQELERLNIIGCPKVTHAGIMEIASATTRGLVEISLEALSQTFDMSAFKTICLRIDAFRRLRAITLTVYINMPLAEWTRDVEELLSSAPLEIFSVYSITKTIRTPILDEFWDGVVAKHGQRLRRISIHRVQIGLAALELICSQCPLLEQLFIVAEENELDDVARLFGLAKNLRTVHINLPMASQSPPMLIQIVASVVAICPQIVHIGCNTKVWQVDRIVREDERGEKCVLPMLAPQERPDIPEQFLVVRA